MLSKLTTPHVDVFWVNCVVCICWTCHFCATDVCHATGHRYLLHSKSCCPDAAEGRNMHFSYFICQFRWMWMCPDVWFLFILLGLVCEVHQEKLWPLPRERATSRALAWSPVQDREGDHEGMLRIFSALFILLFPATATMLLSDKCQDGMCFASYYPYLALMCKLQLMWSWFSEASYKAFGRALSSSWSRLFSELLYCLLS